MAEPFLAELRMMSFGFAPKGWALCNGQLLPINQNQALFSLLGTTYGGDGRVNFALPNLQGRTPLHFGADFSLGERGGQVAHTLIISEMPEHTHFIQAASGAGTTNLPGTGVMLATSTNYEAYRPVSALVPMNVSSITNTGGSQAHNNMQPFLTINFCIALQGIFPSQT